MPSAIELRNLSKRFILRHNASGELKVRFLGLFHRGRREKVEELWALRDISITIGQGESIGVIGRNGSGKSTLLKLIAGIDRPTSGRLLMASGSRVGTLIELGVGFHPELTGQENVYLNAAIHGLPQAAVEAMYPAIVEYSGLGDFMDIPLKTYSSGMQMRLGFAVAANLDPDILLLDEIFAVGDEDFQKRCTRTVRRFLEDGKTIFFVSHSQSAIRAICRRVCLLDHGTLMYDGDVEQGFLAYHQLLTSVGHWTTHPAQHESEPVSDPLLATTGAARDGAWHRAAVGGDWDDSGRRQFDFLRAQGLEPGHYLLDIGCGSLRAGVHLIPFLEPAHYVGFDNDPDLVQAGIDVELAGMDRRLSMFIVNKRFDLSGLRQFDYVFAHAFFPFVSLNVAALCIAAVLGKLAPGVQLYATYYESPETNSGEPAEQPGGVTTYADGPPYHVPFAVLAAICESVGGVAERLGSWGDPEGQMMMRVRKRTP